MNDDISSWIAPKLVERQFYAVRCCCQPTKVLGFLPLPVKGDSRRKITDYTGHSHVIELRTIMDRKYSAYPPESSVTQEMAIYSEERGLDFWSTIPEFMPVSEAVRR